MCALDFRVQFEDITVICSRGLREIEEFLNVANAYSDHKICILFTCFEKLGD